MITRVQEFFFRKKNEKFYGFQKANQITKAKRDFIIMHSVWFSRVIFTKEQNPFNLFDAQEVAHYHSSFLVTIFWSRFRIRLMGILRSDVWKALQELRKALGLWGLWLQIMNVVVLQGLFGFLFQVISDRGPDTDQVWSLTQLHSVSFKVWSESIRTK